VLASLPLHAHELAAMSNRRVPSTRDFYTAIQFSGPRLRPEELEQYIRDVDLENLEWGRERIGAVEKIPEWCEPYQGCLPSESEDDSAVEEEEVEKGKDVIGTRSKTVEKVVAKKRRRRKQFRPGMVEVPSHLPCLPPKHTWLSTPSYPAHSIALQPPLAFLDQKVSSNRLMEASLRGLIRATDAAVFDKQSHKAQQREESRIEADAFGNERPTASPQTSHTIKSSGIQGTSAAIEGSEDEARGLPSKKARTLSLRLRAPSISQPASVIALNSPEVQTPFKKPGLISHRPSVSFVGPQSATLPSFAAHLRRNTSSGPFSADASQSQFNWNSALSTNAFSPLATPITPGSAFNFPSTPLEAYNNGDESQLDAASIALPTTINYKRTWYKKSNHKSTNAIEAHNVKRVKS
jgi:hypothetical protein